MVKVFLDHFVKAHFVAEKRPVISRDHLGYLTMVNAHNLKHKPHLSSRCNCIGNVVS